MVDQNQETRRNKISASLLPLIARSGLANDLKVTGVDGSKPIVIALDEETIGQVFNRISWSGGFANLFIVTELGDGKLALSTASIVAPASSLSERPAEHLEIVDASSPISMLLELARQQTEEVAFNLNFSDATLKVDSVEQAQELIL